MSIGVAAALELDVSAALSAVDEIEARVNEITSGLTTTLDVDTSGVDAAAAEVASIGGDTIEIPVEADTSAAEAAVESIDAGAIEIDVEANTAPAEASIDSLGGSAAEATGGLGGLSGAATELGGSLSGVAVDGGVAAGVLRGGGVAGLAAATGYGAAAAGVFSLAQAYGEAEAVGAVTEQVIRATGGAANLSATDVEGLAGRISDLSGIDDEAVQSAQNLLLTFRNVRDEVGAGNQIFTRASGALADLSRAGFGDVSSNAVRLGRALQDPVKGLTALARAGVTFTEEQKTAVTALVETGNTLEAQKIILDEVESQVGGVAEAYGETFAGQVDRATVSLGNFAEEVGGQVAPALGGLLDLLSQVSGALEDVDLGGSGEGFGPEGGTGGIGALLSRLLPEDEELEARSAAEIINANIAEQLNAVSAANVEAAAATGETSDALAEQGEEAEKAARQVSDLVDILDELHGTQQTVDEGAIEVRENQRALLEGLLELEGGYRAGTDSGDAFIGTARQLASSIRDQTLAVLDNGQGADAARLAQAGYTEGLRRVLRQAGLTDAEINTLIDTYARVPDERITQFETPGAENARRVTQGLKRDLDAIDPRKQITVGISIDGFGSISGIQREVDNLASSIRNLPPLLNESAVNPRAAVVRPPGVVNAAQARGDSLIIQVDARGATSPAAVEAAGERGVRVGLGRTRTRVDQRLAIPR